MGRKGKTKEWYRLDRILSYGCAYNLVIGLRKNGKSYSVLERIRDKIEELDDFVFVYIRRRKRTVVRRKMEDVFADISESCLEKLGSYIKYDGEGKFYIDPDGERKIVGYKTSIEEGFDDKAWGFGVHENVLILFEEFMDLSYMENELQLFQQTIGNIVRDENKQNVEIFMLANTVSKYCPYLEFFGFDMSKIKQGDIATIHDINGGTAALEYCKSKVDDFNKKKTSKYFGFDHPTSKMILHGEWEYNNCNTKEIDNISWKDNRHLVKCYITSLKNVYEMSIYTCTKNPVAFVRTVNTQYGIVNKRIKYNLSFDNSILLKYNDLKPVPIYNKMSERFIDDDVIEDLQIIKECIRCGRIVFQNVRVGTEFSVAFDKIV